MITRIFNEKEGINRLFYRGVLYFCGIGGVSMSSLAQLALARGCVVAGCDRDCSSPAVKKLAVAGVVVTGEEAADPQGASLVICSAAIRPTSPAVVKAEQRGIPVIGRAEFLAAVMHSYPHRITVSGMHGKSSTVGMLSCILIHAGLDPTVLSGAPLSQGGEAYRIGSGNVCLAEACEYRDSFLSLSPTLALVTNIELDHPDYFPDLAAVKHSFSHFMCQSEAVIAGGDCPPLREIAPSNATLFGFGDHCHVRGVPQSTGMEVYCNGKLCGNLSLSVPGVYNLQNALAATAAALRLGVPFPTIAGALAQFDGVGRRMEPVGILPTQGGGARVFLDYAHHPTELTAAITAAGAGGNRVLIAFQPHTYTRTHTLWHEFVSALQLADYTVLTDIYAAREAPLDGTSSSKLAEDAGVVYAPDFPAAAALLRTAAQDGDTILILGAGDIDRLAPLLIPPAHS